MDLLYCRRCGDSTQQLANHVYTCGAHTLFANSSPAASVILTNSAGDLLAGIRGIDPHLGKLDLPGGFVDHQETLEEAAARELHEEVGVAPHEYSPLQYVTSALDPYDYQGETLPVLVAVFSAELHHGAEVAPNDDISELIWIPRNQTNVEEFCFPSAQRGVQQFLLNSESAM